MEAIDKSMICDKCGNKTLVVDGLDCAQLMIMAHVRLIFNMRCERCGRTFKRKYVARIDLDDYEDMEAEE